MQKPNAIALQALAPTRQTLGGAWAAGGPTQALAGMAATLGAVVVGAAVLEAALIPGIAIGAAAVLVPKFWPKARRPSRQALPPALRRIGAIVPKLVNSAATAAAAAPTGFAIKRAVVKTITFRLIVTTLDFTTNYLVLGELAMAAGLSTLGLVAGPVFYFLHESAWTKFGPPATLDGGMLGPAFELPMPFRRNSGAPAEGDRKLAVSRALAKTVTFRVFATTMDFTTTYLVVGDFATAAGLSAAGFVLGPFVYLGHEMAWDRWGGLKAPALGQSISGY